MSKGKKNLDENKLFSEFNSTSFEDWKNLAEKDLKGKDFEKSLVWKTYEGFKVNPLYTEEDISSLGHISDSFVNALGKDDVNNSWSICEEISVSNIKEANHIANDSLNRGANSIAFRCEYHPNSINGIPIQSKEDFGKLINKIDIEKTPINFFPGIAGPQVLSLLASFSNTNKLNLKKIKGCIFCSPLNDLLLEGKFHQDEKKIFNNLGLIVSYLDRNMPNYKALAVDGTNFREAGSSLVQELAFSFSMAVEYLEKLLKEGLKIDSILNSLFFSFSIGSNYFMEIAKLRAARIVWAKIAEQYNPKKKKSTITTIYCRTLRWNKTIYDPQVNMLRATLESMAGAVGGCDYITVMPFNCLYANNNEFSRRIARNTQIILNEESYLDKVVDIAAGSYYIENLTYTIANETLKLFQEVESKGGFIECLKNSFIQNSIKEVQQSKKTNSEFRKEVFLGTNQYPNLSEYVLKSFEESDIKTKISKSATLENSDFNSIEEFIELINTPDFRIANFFRILIVIPI